MPQLNYDRDPAIGKPGMIARPDLPTWVEVGTTQIDSNERKPRPGDGVIRDNTAHGFKIPGTGEFTDIVGVVAHRDQSVATVNTSTTEAVQYDDGDLIYVITFGVVYVRVSTGSGETISFGDRVTWDAPTAITDDAAWGPLPTAAAIPSSFSNTAAVRNWLLAQPEVDIVAVNDTQVAASQTGVIVPVKIGMGR